MGLPVFLIAFSLFVAAFLVHLVLWRIRRPGDDLRALALCLFAVPAGLAIVPGLILYQPGMLLLALLLAWSLGMAYLFWYPAAQAASPTMLITILAGRAGNDGLAEDELYRQISEQTLAGESVENLFKEQFAEEDGGGRVRLAARGRHTFLLIQLLRRLAGFEEPKG